ncbi:cell division protein FtsH, partial [Candidatus Uhrbacteria bacterium]|nr:cell division protein FtsH [Candidatus Uhrbacteria bacterium]
LPNAKPVHKVSIISRGRAAGYTLTLPEKETKMQSKSQFLDEIAVMLAGHTVEKDIFGEVTTGASNDLKTATGLAKKLITRYGMSDVLAPRTYGEREDLIFLGREITEQRDYSEKVAEQIDQEISLIINDAVKKVKEVLVKHRKELELIVEHLVKKETLEKEEFEALFKVPESVPTA